MHAQHIMSVVDFKSECDFAVNSGAAEPLKGLSGPLWESVYRPESHAVRRDRYELLRGVQGILGVDNSHLWTTCGCRKWLQYGAETVDICYQESRRRSHIKGLQNCGSPHLCPVCGGRIADYRVEQIRRILAEHRKAAGLAFMATLTFSHKRTDALEDTGLAEGVMVPGTMRRVWAAWSRMMNSRGYRELMKRYGSLGLVKVLECNFAGMNGAHPHFHVIWCVMAGAFPGVYGHARELAIDAVRQEFEAGLRACWHQALDSVGLTYEAGVDRKTGLPNRDRSCMVKDASWSDAEYLEKVKRARQWGAEQELGKGRAKKGRKGSLTPMDLVRCYLGQRDDVPAFEAAAMFRSYAVATYGKCGTYISPALYELYEVPNLSEMAIVEGLDHVPSVKLVELDEEQWRVAEPHIIGLMGVADSGRRELVVAWLRARGVPVIERLQMEGGHGPPEPVTEGERRRAMGVYEMAEERWLCSAGYLKLDAWMRLGDEEAF